MTFKKCRKCGYKFVPGDYTYCPKCNASLALPREVAAVMKTMIMAGVVAGLVYIFVFILPRVSISFN
jgi:ribosomal protein L40E